MPIILSGTGTATNPQADRFGIVSLSAGGRAIPLLDLQDGVGYTRERGTFAFTPGVPTVQQSRLARRYGGAKTVGVTHDNGQITWTAMVRGVTQEQAAQRVEILLTEIEDAARGRLIEWRPAGLGHSSFFRITGPGTANMNYQWIEWSQVGMLRGPITFPVFPLAEWAPMSIGDDFAVDSLADYTFDAGAAGNVAVTGSALDAVANLTTENRLIHTDRGYDYAAGQVTLKATPGATIASFKAGVILERVDALNYAEVYVDDNATNSRLRIDKIVAGVPTNLVSTNLAARVVAGTAFWVRGRREAGSIVAEYFLAANPPTPMVAATLTNTAAHTLAAGKPGIVWTPQHTNATVDDFQVRAYAKRNVTLPEKIALPDIPGNAPAKLDVTVTPSGGSAAPIWAMLAWAPTASALVGGAVVPFGILEAESAANLSGWVSAADAGSRGGNRLIDATVSGAETYTASWTIDPNPLAADLFTDGELTLEVWAIAILDFTLVSPKLTLSTRPIDGLNFGSERFTDDYGSAGKLLAVPSSGTGKRRPVRLGTLTVPVDPLRPRALHLWLAGSTATGSTGAFGIDYLWTVPARARALSPTGKPLDAAFPKFVASTNQTSKLIRPDLSGGVANPPADPHPDHGLGGSLLELPPGDMDLLVKLSSVVPDDSAAGSTSEQLAHSATVEVDVTPRSFLLRST